MSLQGVWSENSRLQVPHPEDGMCNETETSATVHSVNIP